MKYLKHSFKILIWKKKIWILIKINRISLSVFNTYTLQLTFMLTDIKFNK